MRATKLAPIAAAAIAAALVLTGCGGGTTTGQAVKSGGDTETVDPASLDTGTFPTTPRPPFTTVGDEFLGRSVEGQRMAEFVVLPPEVDPTLTESASMSTYVIKDGKSLGILLPGPTPQVAADNGMLVGFSTARSTPGKANDSSLVHAVLRFPDAAAATKAANAMHQSVLGYDFGNGLPAVGKVNALPEALASTSESGGVFSANAFTPHNEYVIYTWASAPAAQKNWTADVIAKAYELQAPMIEKFPATDPANYANLEIDVDGVLRYTLPTEGSQSTSSLAVYGSRGAAHSSTNALANLENFTRTGTTHQAVDATNVYLSDTEEGSQQLRDAFLAEMKTENDMAEDAAPPNVPGAACLSAKTYSGTEYYCLVQFGKRLGELGGLDNLPELHQMAAAQYLILQAAED